MTVITIMGKDKKISDNILKNTVKKLKSKGYLLHNGKLSETITRKTDILLYLIYLWKNNKGKINVVSNVRLSKIKVMKLMRKFNMKKIKEIVDEVNSIIYDENLILGDAFSEKDYEDMILYLEDELDKCKKAIDSVVIEPKVKFLTNGISIPKNSVSIKFSSENN
tara:strand:- start:5068 stop:5562 length:495 start_codon:yes stop_codon:yes gene_type:complete